MKPLPPFSFRCYHKGARFLKELLSPPSVDNPQDNLFAQTLHYLLVFCIFIGITYAILTWFIADEPSGTIISVSMVVLAMILFGILKKKRIRLVSIVLVAGGYLAIMSTLIMNGGIRDEATLVLIALLSIAGFLLGMRAVIPIGIVTAVLLIALFIAEKADQIPEEEHLVPIAADELVMALIAVFVTTVVLHQFTKHLIWNTEAMKDQAEFLRQQNIQLEETHQALVMAKDAAEEANRSRTLFLSRLSHDLRTPLSSLLSLANHLQTYEEELSTEEKKELLESISSSGTHLLDLINDLLDISRLEAQQMQLHIYAMSLAEMLSNVTHILQHTAHEKGLAFILQQDENLPEIVYGDQQRLQQILINLLGNSIKFTEQGDVCLKVTAVSSETAVSNVLFEVSDSGSGIDPEQLDEIFEPFVQLNEDKFQATGSGLGLSISRQLVQVMGGTLQVESWPGEGSRFWFTLPLPTEPSVEFGQT